MASTFFESTAICVYSVFTAKKVNRRLPLQTEDSGIILLNSFTF
ncbi:hypothetical protein E6C60_3288 [Paenibacillus algicola]|uniref:Uncharacterized protein n=1 Tax=Paenibacillus algicola TaxID=2565926 RepID=A0A4P8XTF5_9BACL|nr:hypothetical protein E6C60_3288 [Paenibacillus algicola]